MYVFNLSHAWWCGPDCFALVQSSTVAYLVSDHHMLHMYWSSTDAAVQLNKGTTVNKTFILTVEFTICWYVYAIIKAEVYKHIGCNLGLKFNISTQTLWYMACNIYTYRFQPLMTMELLMNFNWVMLQNYPNHYESYYDPSSGFRCC